VSEAQPPPGEEEFLTSAEVAAMFRVDIRTVAQWAKTGKVTSIRTPGGVVLRFHAAQFRDASQVPPGGEAPDA
jgi:phage terminase Nu1 subunit (DNA packaging protein)